MIRKIIRIDEHKCNGCGICAKACHEGAIGIVDGKAKLLREDHCDGLGDCLPSCPLGAISFEEREALAYDELSVKRAMKKRIGQNFPVQLRLVPANAPFLQEADLLICADCCAYCHRDFRKEFMDGKVTLIGCPKLDGQDYSEKLAQILQENRIRSLTVARMTVPCCGGLAYAVDRAVELSEKEIPIRKILIHPDGTVRE